MNNNKIKVNWSGTEEALSESVRKYAADVALKRINRETVSLLLDEKSVNGVKIYRFPYYIHQRIRKEQDVLISGWTLHNLSYQIIKYSNDYRSGILEREDDLAILLCASVAFDRREEKEYLNKFEYPKWEKMVYFWTGFCGEQSNYQVFQKNIDDFTRELYILTSGRFCSSTFNVDNIVKKETGLTWINVIRLLQVAWIKSFVPGDLRDLDSLKEYSIDSQDYNTILERYTSTYDDIRNDKNNLGRQQLYCTPFVKTQKGEVISINVFLNMFLIDHCIFWIVRDYFWKNNSQIFVSEFGKMFENYFAEVLSDYLQVGEFKRLPEEKTKRADWELTIDHHKFLVEQKSSILNLPVKQQLSDLESMKRYYCRNIDEACKQLSNTEKDFAGEYIKVILLYDSYIVPNLLSDFIQNCNLQNVGGPFWIMTIDEMEMLLYFCKQDRKEFHVLIDEKIKKDSERSKEGSSVENLLNNRGLFGNEHLKGDKFSKYRKLYKEPFSGEMDV